MRRAIRPTTLRVLCPGKQHRLLGGAPTPPHLLLELRVVFCLFIFNFVPPPSVSSLPWAGALGMRIRVEAARGGAVGLTSCGEARLRILRKLQNPGACAPFLSQLEGPGQACTTSFPV